MRQQELVAQAVEVTEGRPQTMGLLEIPIQAVAGVDVTALKLLAAREEVVSSLSDIL